MNERALQIFRSGQAYEQAAWVLNTGPSKSPALLIPSMVNAALSLELYFKALYVLEKKVEFKINGRHSHDFHGLFKELSERTRISMTARFDKAISERDMSDVRALQEQAGVAVSMDLSENLSDWATCFVDFRYVHHFLESKKGQQKTMMFFPEISSAVKATIVEMEPTCGP